MIIVAHRGLHHDHPENSLPAIQAAHAAGFDWVEIDVHESADGEPVVIHDATLDRTTSSTGPVAARSAAELRAIRLKMPDGSAQSCNLPLLSACIGNGNLLVEIKPHNATRLVKKVIERLRAHRGKWVVQSFDPANVRAARQFDPEIECALLLSEPHDLPRALAEGWAAMNLRHSLLTADVARRLRETGVRVGVWTPNSAPDIATAIGFAVDVLITDEPELSRQITRGIRT